MGIASSSANGVSATRVDVSYSAFPNGPGASVSSAWVLYGATSGALGARQSVPTSSIVAADPTTGLPAGSVTCSVSFDPSGLGVTTVFYQVCVAWSDQTQDIGPDPSGAYQVNVPAASPQPGPATGATLSAPTAPVQSGSPVAISVTVQAANGAGSNKSVSFAVSNLDGGGQVNGSVSPSQATTGADGSASTTYTSRHSGKVRITASCETVKASADVKILGHGDDGGHGDGGDDSHGNGGHGNGGHGDGGRGGDDGGQGRG